MAMDFELYGDIIGTDIDTESVDYLTGGADAAYPFATWLSGMQGKTPIVIKQGNKWVEDGEKQASGIWFEADKTPDDLKEIAQLMAADQDEEGRKKKPTAEFCHVQHDDGTVKLYWRIFHLDCFVLAHGVPSQWSVMHFDKQSKEWSHDPAKQLGIARGTLTKEDRENDKQSTYNFFSFLVIVKQLATTYVDESGRPKPIMLYFKSINTGVMERELGYHLAFLKEHREWYAKVFLPSNEDFVKKFGNLPKLQQQKIATKIAQHHIQFWSYCLHLDRTPDRRKHESKNASANAKQNAFQKVYEPQNQSVDLYKQHEDAEKALYCGDKMYRTLQSFVYDTSVNPPVPGGDAVINCRNRVEGAYNNQLELNPFGDNQFGSNKQRPAWMAKRAVNESHGMHEDQSDIPASMRSGVTSTTTATATATATQGDRFTKMRVNVAVNKLKDMHAAFVANNLEEALEIWPVTNKEMQSLPDAKKLELLSEARSVAEELLQGLKAELGPKFIQPETEEEY